MVCFQTKNPKKPFGIFYGDWGYFMTIWYILYSFGTFFPVSVLCTKKNLATLITYVDTFG
jgi:hypothetical protein